MSRSIKLIFNEIESRDLLSEDSLVEIDSNFEDLNSAFHQLSKDLVHFDKTRLREEIFGMGPLNALIENPDITEIIINGFNNISFECGCGLTYHDDFFFSEASYARFLSKLYDQISAEPTVNHPFVSGIWNGFRVQISYKGVSSDSTQVTLRRVPKNKWSLSSLLDVDWAPKEVAQLLQSAIHERKNILIIGPTNSGKTSVLSALLKEIPDEERAIILEDTQELELPNLHSTRMVTRQDSRGILTDITLQNLVRQSLRMRPDRIVIGEVRGSESNELLLALSTGHSGSFATLHARNAREALIRLEMLIQMGSPQWKPESIRQLIFSSLDWVLTVSRNKDGIRQLQNISSLSSNEPTGITLDCVWKRNQDFELI